MATYDNLEAYQTALDALVRTKALINAGSNKNDPDDIKTLLLNLGETIFAAKTEADRFQAESTDTFPDEITMSQTLLMDASDRLVLSANKAVTKAETGNVLGVTQFYHVQGNGVATLTFSTDFEFIIDDRPAGNVLDNDITYLVNMAEFPNKTQVNVIVTSIPAIDVQAPTLDSAAVANDTPSVLNLGFSEAVNATIAGFAIATDGAALSITGVASGSGTANVNFTLSRVLVFGETVTLTYDANTGSTADLAGNALASIVAPFSVTNSVINSSEEDITISNLTAGTYNAGPPQTITATSTSCNATGGSLTLTDGNYVEIEYTGANNDASVISLTDSISNAGWTTINNSLEHAVFIGPSGEITSRQLTVSNNEGVFYTSGTWRLRLELADAGGGSFNVLYKYSSDGGSNYTTFRTVVLGIATVNIFLNIAVSGKILRRPVKLDV